MRNSTLLREHRVRDIGEVQSQQGKSAKAKTAALAQAGIYSVGQDMTVHVAMAMIDPLKVTREESMREISYKLCNSVHPYKLYDTNGLASFASTFIGMLKATL